MSHVLGCKAWRPHPVLRSVNWRRAGRASPIFQGGVGAWQAAVHMTVVSTCSSRRCPSGGGCCRSASRADHGRRRLGTASRDGVAGQEAPFPAQEVLLLHPALPGTSVRAHAVVRSPTRWPAAYAQNLHVFMRKFVERGCDLIMACLPGEEGLRLALANRLRRAAGPRCMD
ncbi:Sua5 family C-terminal domain-containing protein [Nonomuraea sp. NPDC050663]|uniref:Sua5 family C-terminal domain-containing protein n=1 Tax=Nonomuraea sp. NPDC050663 TaxID=3364370 RepID=UPI0037B2645E